MKSYLTSLPILWNSRKINQKIAKNKICQKRTYFYHITRHDKDNNLFMDKKLKLQIVKSKKNIEFNK